MACEDFPEVFREAERSRLIAEVHRNTEGGVLSFFTLKLLAEIRELCQGLTSQTPVLGSDSTGCQIPARKGPRQAWGLAHGELEGGCQANRVVLIVSPASFGHWEPKLGKPLGRGPQGWSGTHIPDVNRLAVAWLGFLWKVGHWE